MTYDVCYTGGAFHDGGECWIENHYWMDGGKEVCNLYPTVPLSFEEALLDVVEFYGGPFTPEGEMWAKVTEESYQKGFG